MLTPKTGIGAGVLHRNSMALAAEGPWGFAGVVWGDAVEGPSDGEAMRPEHRACGGTCEVCGASIINIVYAQNKAGKRVSLGIDCAETLWTNQSKSAALLKTAVSAKRKEQRQAAAERKTARDAAHNLANEAEALAILDRLGTFPVGDFARGFGLDVARRLRAGAQKGLSAAQRTLMAKLAAERGF